MEANTIYKTLSCSKCGNEFTIEKHIIRYDCCETNNRPYFYIIQEKSTGIYYAGSKYAKDANYTNLLTEFGYKTSSNTITKLINENGVDSFIIRRIRVFDDKIKAYEYETKFLKKINASKNNNFYNLHNNAWSLRNAKEIFLKKYGVDHNMKCPEVQEKRINTIIRKYGSVSNMVIKTGAAYKAADTFNKRYPIGSHARKEYYEKNKNKCLEKYGVTNHFNINMKDAKEKAVKTKRERSLPEIKEVSSRLLDSNIDFTSYGWVGDAATIIGITPQKVHKWMIRNMPDFYETCYQRKKKRAI